MSDPEKKSAPQKETAVESQPRKDEQHEVVELLQSEAPDVLKALPKDKRDKLIAVVRSIVVTKHHQGPIPSPEDIALYNQHIPNGADRIMSMAEEQSKHRMKLEGVVINSQQKQSERGQVFGLIIGIFGITLGSIVTLLGHDWVGGGIAGTTVISLVYAFITGKRAQKKDLESKSKSLPHQP